MDNINDSEKNLTAGVHLPLPWGYILVHDHCILTCLL